MAMTKKELRKYYKAQRANLSTQEIEQAGAILREKILEKIPPKSNVAIFLPISNHSELDLTPLLTNTEYNWYASRSEFTTRTMVFYKIDSTTEFEINEWNIPEPPENGKISPSEIDVVVIPLLVCDLKGNRIGYGMGFYDNFLALCKESCLKLGINYFPPVSSIADVRKDDIQLNVLLTPEKDYIF